MMYIGRESDFGGKKIDLKFFAHKLYIMAHNLVASLA